MIVRWDEQGGGLHLGFQPAETKGQFLSLSKNEVLAGFGSCGVNVSFLVPCSRLSLDSYTFKLS
jgi:hypothetical protein